MAEKDKAVSPAEEISELAQRNRTIEHSPESEERTEHTGLQDEARINRLEQAVTHIESLLEKLYEHQAASATDEIRREMARLAGRLDAIEGLRTSGPPATHKDDASSGPSRPDPGLARLAQLTRSRRSLSNRGPAIAAGVGTLLDLDGRMSANGLLSAYHQARNGGSGRNRR